MTIRPALGSELVAVTNLWEASVRATHDFLSEEDLCELRPRVLNEWLPLVRVMVFTGTADEILGFSGISGDMLDMLFVAPTARGLGIGKALVEHAVSEMSVKRVDVNEQNRPAVGFYRHMGFEVIGRSSVDAQGKPYPLLHLRLPPSSHPI